MTGKKPPQPSRDGRKELGRFGEELAAGYMAGRGMRILERNWRVRSGEIDIIAADGDVLVFAEVRTRRPSGRFGSPEESVDARKQKQVRETAQLYLHFTRQYNAKCRFDVIAVTTGEHAGAAPAIRHIPNAF